MAEFLRSQSDNRMRVLRIAHASLTPALRERERSLARCYSEIDLEVVTTERWREAEVDVNATPDDLFPVKSSRAHLSRHIQLFAYDPRPIIDALRQHRPHLIDLNHEPYSVACAEILTLRNLFHPTAPVVIQAAQNIYRKYPPPFNLLEKRALKQVDAAYVCNVAAGEVLRRKGFTRRAALIPFGVNTEVFQPRASARKESAPLTIGFVGRMLPGKGLNVLAEALAKLADKDWLLLVVGDGSERERFHRVLSTHGLASRVQFAGAVSHDRVSEYYQKMDMLVVPTQTTARIREQFGRVIVEAMASGVPVIGSTCGAIPEVIDAAGIIFPEGDADALARAVNQALSDATLRESLARAGCARAESEYSWDKVAEKTFQLFCDVLSTRAAAPNLSFANLRGREAIEKGFIV